MAARDVDRITEPSPEEKALYHSVLENVVDYVGADNLQRVILTADVYTGAAQVDICLEDESWERVSHAIQRMGEVRLMFMDELSIDFTLTADDQCASIDHTVTKDLVYA